MTGAGQHSFSQIKHTEMHRLRFMIIKVLPLLQ